MEMDQVGDYEKPAIVRVFGHEVKDFSSQYGAEERMSYAAQNLAGDFNIYPNYGDFTQACVFVSCLPQGYCGQCSWSPS